MTEPERAEAAAAAEPAGPAPEADGADKQPLDEAKVFERLRELLPTVDLTVTTEKMIRAKLEEEFKQDMSSIKKKIRGEIEKFLEAQGGAEEEGEEEEEEEEAPKKKRKAGGGLQKTCVLSPAMASIVGEERMSRPQVVKKLWEYIRANNLQNPKDKRKIILDDKLKTIFPGPVSMFSMNKHLSKHIKRADEVAGPSKSSSGEESASSGSDEDDDDDEEEGGKSSKKRKAAPKAAPRRKSGGGGGGGGFTKQVTLSAELAAFVGQPTMSRPELTSFFNKYFKDNDLKDPSDKRFVLSDDKLKKLFGETRFQAFGVQKHLSRHIVK